jgi:hypothetical protein
MRIIACRSSLRARKNRRPRNTLEDFGGEKGFLFAFLFEDYVGVRPSASPHNRAWK